MTLLAIPTRGERPENLRLALETWYQYAGHLIDRIVILGAEPPDLTIPHSFVEVPQAPRRTHENQQRALHAAMSVADPSEDVIWAHDDMFLVETINRADLIEMQHVISRVPSTTLADIPPKSVQTIASKNTGIVLKKKGMPHWNYELHLPLLMTKDQYEICRLGLDGDMQLRSWFLNHKYRVLHQPRAIQDVKLRSVSQQFDGPLFSADRHMDLNDIMLIMGFAQDRNNKGDTNE